MVGEEEGRLPPVVLCCLLKERLLKLLLVDAQGRLGSRSPAHPLLGRDCHGRVVERDCGESDGESEREGGHVSVCVSVMQGGMAEYEKWEGADVRALRSGFRCGDAFGRTRAGKQVRACAGIANERDESGTKTNASPGQTK